MYLVIGGNGFLGRAIVSKLLQRGEQVRVLCRSGFDPPFAPIAPHAHTPTLILGDIRDREAVLTACRGCHTVFHTAALPSISVHWKPFYEINVLGAQNVIDACLETGVKKLIYTSSTSVTCGGALPQENMDESAPYPTRWLAHYPHTKAIAEQLVLETTGILRCVVRPHLIMGPGDRHLIPRLLDRARRGKLIRVGDGSNMMDMTSIDNAVNGHLLAADALAPGSVVDGRIYYITNGRPVNCWAQIDEFLKEHGLPPVKKSISFKTAWRIGAALEGLYKLFRLSGEPQMTRFLALELAQSHYFNISRAKQDFGYEPQ